MGAYLGGTGHLSRIREAGSDRFGVTSAIARRAAREKRGLLLVECFARFKMRTARRLLAQGRRGGPLCAGLGALAPSAPADANCNLKRLWHGVTNSNVPPSVRVESYSIIPENDNYAFIIIDESN